MINRISFASFKFIGMKGITVLSVTYDAPNGIFLTGVSISFYQRIYYEEEEDDLFTKQNMYTNDKAILAHSQVQYI